MAAPSVQTRFVLFKAQNFQPTPYEPYETPADDVLLAGSSDEDTGQDRQRKRQRREDACQFYLRHGQPRLISTAQLRGPFEPQHVAKPRKRKVRRQLQGQNEKRREISKGKTITEQLIPAVGQSSVPKQPQISGQADHGESKDRKRITAREDSPSLHLPVVDPPPSSPTPQSRSVLGRPKRCGEKERRSENEKRAMAISSLKSPRGADEPIKLDSPPKLRASWHKRDYDSDVIEVQANCASSPARRPLKVADSNVRSKARKQNLRTRAVSITAQSPFQYVPTRLLRRQRQQLEQLLPEKVNVEDGGAKSSKGLFVRKQQTTETSLGSQDTIQHVPRAQSSGPAVSTKNQPVIQQFPEDEPAQRSLSMLPQQERMPDYLQGGLNLGIGGEKDKCEPKDTMTGEDDTSANVQAASLKFGADKPQGKIQAATGTQSSSSNAAATFTDQSISNPISGRQEDGQQVSACRASTEVFETEKPLLESRRSQPVVSTQAAFSDALAGLYTPDHAFGTVRKSQQMALSSKRRRSNAPTDELESQDLNLGTQALLAKAPRFSISPDFRRRTEPVGVDNLPQAHTVRNAALPEIIPPASRFACKIATSPRTKETESFINLFQSHPSSPRASEAAEQALEQTPTLNGSFRKFFENTKSSQQLARPESESRGRKRKRTSNNPSATQPSSAGMSQGVLAGRITKSTGSTASSTRQKKGESAWSDLKTSNDWQDAQRDRGLDVFKQTDAGMMDDDTLDETIRDIEGFLGSWTSDFES